MASREVTARDNGRTAWSRGRPLGVVCPCGHRALVPLERLAVGPGDMRPLLSLALACSACGRRGGDRVDDRGAPRLWLLSSAADEAAFLAAGRTSDTKKEPHPSRPTGAKEGAS